MSHGFWRIKIHVLLNHSSYLRRRGWESMMSFYSVRFVALEVCGLGLGIIFRSMCKCSSKIKKNKNLFSWLIRLYGIQDCSISCSREQASFISDIPWLPPQENISHLSVSSLWVCAWSWSTGMEAPSMGHRLLHIPFFHQQIHRVSLFLIDFSPPSPPFLSLSLSLHMSCSFSLFLLFPSTE